MQPLDNSVWEFNEIIVAVLLGFLFGWALDKGGMTRYHKIVNVFRFTDLAVLKFMMSAMVTGMVGIYALNWMGEVDLAAITPTVPIKNFAGGLLFGVGMALIGMCPGTSVSGAARGQLDYLIPGLGGFLVGGLVYGMLYPTITEFFTDLQKSGHWYAKDYGHAKLPELWDLNSVLLVLVFAEAILLMLYLVDRLRLRRPDALTKKIAAAEGGD
jgi:hypothetical protein